jgi:general secretion pathway protein D
MARNKKGDAYMVHGRSAEVRKEYEKALELYELAITEDPADTGYQIAAKRVRFQAGMGRVDLGQKLRAEGKLEEALEDFRKAYAIDPALGIAEQEIKKTLQMIEQRKAQPSTSSENIGLTPSEQAEKEIEDRVARMRAVPELKPITRQISTLKMNNQPVRVLYETVGKLAGVNVVMDPEFTPAGGKANFTVDLTNTTLDEALEHLSIITKTFWKPLSSNTIFVTADNVTKRRDYEDFVVKVFYIRNATTVQELQEIATTVRSIAEIRRAFTYNGLNAIMVRDTADKVALAEKLIADLDKPRAEVVVDVLVMQANRTRVRDLAATITTNGAPGIDIPITYTGKGYNPGDPDNDTPASNLLPLSDWKNIRLSDFSASVPGALIKAVANDSTTRVMQQPQLRAIENQKASLRIGDRVPYASGSFTPTVGGGGAGFVPYAQTQFQFADVGVNVDLTPKVHGRDEISMHIEVEISNVSGEVEISGVKQPIISQRKVVHDIRIKEGEVNLLGGLMASEDVKTMAGIPGLMRIPFFKYFFGSEGTDRREGELLIALMPHIVRAPDFDEVNLRGVSAGSDTVVKLSYSPRKEAAQAAPGTPPPPAPGIPPAEGQQQPAPAEQQQTPPAEVGGAPKLVLNPAASTVPVSAPFTVTVQMENASDLFSARMRVKFDPKLLRLTSVREGGLLGGDGQRVTFNESTQNDTGESFVSLNRVPGAGGTSGSGGLVTLTFQPVAAGTAQITIGDLTLRNAQLQPIEVATPSAAITIQ